MGRAEYEGGLYHVLSRGNERKDIFHDDRDRLTFLDAIGEMADNYDVDIFAYVLMGKHYARCDTIHHLFPHMHWYPQGYSRENVWACKRVIRTLFHAF